MASWDEVNRIGSGFNLSKDFVLKAGLMLADIASVGFKVENFNHANMGTLEQVWADARRAIVLTVELAASFGLSEQTLRADSALLPVAYYLFKRKPPHNWLSHPGFAEDRDTIRSWLIRSLLKSSGIWGSGLDTLLTALRGVIRENHTQFPAEQLEQVMAGPGNPWRSVRRKSMTFSTWNMGIAGCFLSYRYSTRSLMCGSCTTWTTFSRKATCSVVVWRSSVAARRSLRIACRRGISLRTFSCWKVC